MSTQTSTPGPLENADAAAQAAADDAVAGSRKAWGHGLATVAEDGTVLDVWYPFPALGSNPQTGSYGIPAELMSLADTDPHRRVKQHVVTTEVDLDSAPVDTADAYLRLHLLSHRLVKPRELVMDGIFGVLANVVWTNHGPCAVTDFERVRLSLRANVGPVTVFGIDKFPRMTDYVAPSGVRIADADRVRLGAHLAPGTTVMHEGFVNFNAGTLGNSMVEGRISAGVVVGEGSDVGGGASIMGTLSGGGKEVISIGERTLLGANSGTGIALGDDCIVEAGTYITAGTKVSVLDESGAPVRTTAARTLSGASGLLFRRNSVSGAVEALPRKGVAVELNAALHAN